MKEDRKRERDAIHRYLYFTLRNWTISCRKINGIDNGLYEERSFSKSNIFTFIALSESNNTKAPH
jgi:hypothetical protein